MPDPIAMLEADHRKVETLFDQYSETQDPLVAQQICTELTVHATLEEQHVYPVVKSDVPEGQELEQEAEQEHAEVKALIRQIEQRGYDDAGVPELILKIEEGVSHHVEEEEGEMFPKLRQALDGPRLEQLGEEAAQAKQQILQQVTGGQGQGATVEGELTKDDLYEMAKEQDVEGRSKMNKEELQRAVEQ